MTVARFPSLAHWGAFTALVENGRLVGCEPFARDPAPSNMIDAMPEMVHSPLRIARPAIREGWREGKPRTGADSYREVSWDEALDTVAGEVKRVREKFGHTSILGGSYGWSSAGRVHHARSLVRRFLFLGGGCIDQVSNYSFGAAYFLLPRVIGTFAAGGGRGHGLVVDRQAHAADDRLRRPRHQERPGDLGRRRRPHHGAVAAPRERRRHRVRFGEHRSSPTRPTSSARSGSRSDRTPTPP